MKRKSIVLLFLFVLIFSFKVQSVYAATQNSDDTISNILEGIDEEEFSDVLDFINSSLNSDKSLKEFLVDFLTGNINFNFNFFINVLETIYEFCTCFEFNDCLFCNHYLFSCLWVTTLSCRMLCC